MSESKTVFVTGATGLVGSHVVEEAISRGHRVRALVRGSSDTSWLDRQDVEKVIGDLEDPKALEEGVQGADLVFNCAAKVGDWGTLEEFRRLNVAALKRLLDASVDATVGRFVHVSSLGVYEGRDHFGTDESTPPAANSLDAYTRSKTEAEALVLEYHREKGLPVSIVRPGFIYGERDRTVLPKLLTVLKKGRFFYFGSGDQALNCIYVKNLVAALFLAAESPLAVGEVFNVTDGDRVSKRQFVGRQASGDLDRLTASSDIYSLGATLYYLLTGKSAFQGKVVEVLEAVRKGQFPPPRSVARWISPALEAVCLKAMALKPEDRYESARGLANDLERWLADEPVTAYKEPRRVKLARWERRHKLLVYGTLLSSIIAAVGLGIIASVVSEQKRISELAKEQADHNAGVAEVNLKLAVNTAYQLLSMFSDQEVSQIPGMTATRVRLSASAVATFDELARSKPDDLDLLQKAARVFSNAAYAEGSVGRNAMASGYFQRAIKLLERCDKRMGTSPVPPYRATLIEEYCKLAAFLQDRGLYEMGSDWGFSRSRDQARKRVDELMADSPGDSTDPFMRHPLAGRVDLIDGFTALEC